jgi:hypothetical protein
MRKLVCVVGLGSMVACAGGSVPARSGVAPQANASADSGAASARVAVPSACALPEKKPDAASTFTRRSSEPEHACTTFALDDAEDGVLGGPADARGLDFKPWDHSGAPAGLDRVARRLGLTAKEREVLMRQGFVVPERLRASDYALAYHEIYESELPLYVSVDSILHAIYAGNDALLVAIESARLSPMLGELLERLYRALPKASARYPPEVAADLDVYVTVARRLFEGKDVPSQLGNDAEVARLTAAAMDAGGMQTVSLFGRERVVDFSQYKPRGHYARTAEPDNPWPNSIDLRPYFRAAMWLSRIEFNLVTRSCQSSSPGGDTAQTPREATTAVALADLTTSADAMCDIEMLDRAWSLLAGRREDVSIAQLAASVPRTQIATTDTGHAVVTAFENDPPRTARTGFTWEGCTELPVIGSMLGPRIVADAAMAKPLTHSDTPDRQMLGAPDIAYALGGDRALAYLTADLAQYPLLAENLRTARGIARAPLGQEDLYSAWFGAIREIQAAPDGATPSFMKTPEFADMRMGSTVAAFAQIRHNYVLMAAQPYSEAGCEIPDGFVDPVPAVYEELIAYAERGRKIMDAIDPKDDTGARAYFAGLARTLRVLDRIAKDELANRPLSDDERRFLSMIVEITSGSHTTGGSPRFEGWYFDLFGDHHEAFGGADFVADYFTSGDTGRVAHAGVRGVMEGVFVVDTGGQPRVVVGPVADAYGYTSQPGQRLTDAEAKKLSETEIDRRWSRSYMVPGATEEPPLTITARTVPVKGKMPAVTLFAKSTRDLGPVTIELYDHHRNVVGAVTHPVSKTSTVFAFAPSRPVDPDARDYEGMHVTVGDYQYFALGTAEADNGDTPFVLGSFTKVRLGR